jgi:hypothetical protein
MLAALERGEMSSMTLTARDVDLISEVPDAATWRQVQASYKALMEQSKSISIENDRLRAEVEMDDEDDKTARRKGAMAAVATTAAAPKTARKQFAPTAAGGEDAAAATGGKASDRIKALRAASTRKAASS